jgi:hypothetical protein
MRSKISLALLAIPLIFNSCATPQPPVAFHQTDKSAVVIDALNDHIGKMVQPVDTARANEDALLAKMRALPQHQTAIVILENYNEPTSGDQFRMRSAPWFVGLRQLGYQRIVFLQGKGVADPEGLPTIARYD